VVGRRKKTVLLSGSEHKAGPREACHEDRGEEGSPEVLRVAVIGTDLTIDEFNAEQIRSVEYKGGMGEVFRLAVGEPSDQKQRLVVCLPEYHVPASLYQELGCWFEGRRAERGKGVIVFGTHVSSDGYNVAPIMVYDGKATETYFQYKNYLSPEEDRHREHGARYTGRGLLKLVDTPVGIVGVAICYDLHSQDDDNEFPRNVGFLCVPSFNDSEAFVRERVNAAVQRKSVLLYANGYGGSHGIESRITDPFDILCRGGNTREALGIRHEREEVRKSLAGQSGHREVTFAVEILTCPFALLGQVAAHRSHRIPGR
jgi:hypothetical protein